MMRASLRRRSRRTLALWAAQALVAGVVAVLFLFSTPALEAG